MLTLLEMILGGLGGVVGLTTGGVVTGVTAGVVVHEVCVVQMAPVDAGVIVVV